MKNKKIYIIISIIIIAILTFVIPVRTEEHSEWHSDSSASGLAVSYATNVKGFYNIYGIKIWQK